MDINNRSTIAARYARRRFLRGMGLGAAAAPLALGIGDLMIGRALGQTTRRKLAVFFVHGECWNGGGTDHTYVPPGVRDLTLAGPNLAKTVADGQDADMTGVAWPPFVTPLAPWKDRMVLVDGLPLVGVSLDNPSNNHGQGNAALSAVGRASTPSGITIDQHVAAALGRDTPVKSLLFGLGTRSSGGDATGTFCSGPGVGMKHSQTPAALLSRLVGAGGNPTPGAPAPTVLGSKLLDLLREDLRRLDRGLAAEEKAQLAEYLTSMENFQKKEQGLADVITQVGCAFPGNIPVSGGDARAAFGSMFRLSTLALRCGVTNVVGATLGNTEYHDDLEPFVPSPYVAHTQYDAAMRSLAPVSMGWVATMLKELGPLADSLTLTIVPANGLGHESSKSHHGCTVSSAFIFDGPRALRTGARLLRTKRHLADLYTTLAGVLGAPVAKFNNAGAGPIKELLA